MVVILTPIVLMVLGIPGPIFFAKLKGVQHLLPEILLKPAVSSDQLGPLIMNAVLRGDDELLPSYIGIK